MQWEHTLQPNFPRELIGSLTQHADTTNTAGNVYSRRNCPDSITSGKRCGHGYHLSWVTQFWATFSEATHTHVELPHPSLTPQKHTDEGTEGTTVPTLHPQGSSYQNLNTKDKPRLSEPVLCTALSPPCIAAGPETCCLVSKERMKATLPGFQSRI